MRSPAALLRYAGSGHTGSASEAPQRAEQRRDEGRRGLLHAQVRHEFFGREGVALQERQEMLRQLQAFKLRSCRRRAAHEQPAQLGQCLACSVGVLDSLAPQGFE